MVDGDLVPDALDADVVAWSVPAASGPVRTDGRSMPVSGTVDRGRWLGSVGGYLVRRRLVGQRDIGRLCGRLSGRSRVEVVGGIAWLARLGIKDRDVLVGRDRLLGRLRQRLGL